MRELGSKRDVTEKEKHTEAETDQRLEHAKEHTQEVETARGAWDAMDSPALLDTAEELRRIADVIERHATGETERHHGDVMEGVDAERQEVSEPTSEASVDEERTGREVEGRGEGAGRYATEIEQTARSRTEAAEFLRGVADASDSHQEKSREESERLSEEAKNAAEGLKKF